MTNESLETTPGPWEAYRPPQHKSWRGFEIRTVPVTRTVGKTGKYIGKPLKTPAEEWEYVTLGMLLPSITKDGDAYLIAAAPTMFKEIQETRKRLDALLAKLRGKVDEDTLIALATMEMDLNRVVAIADGSWPGVRDSEIRKPTDAR